MKRMHFLWVDDQRSKVEAYQDVITAGVRSYRASLDVLEVKRDLLEQLSRWCTANKSDPPDLIIIDHIFNTSLPFGIKGSSVAHLLRNEFRQVPMVCVTAMFDRPRSFDQEDISEYTALFLYHRLDDHIEDLYSIARDFPKLHPTAVSLRAHLVNCMRPPARDRKDLDRILPDEFQDTAHGTTNHRVARWIFNTLLRRPGFLYDRLHAATLLGLTEGGFSKVEHFFDRARYKGVFATERNPRWWSSALNNILYAVAGDDAPDIPQLAGRTLHGITDDDYSVCYVTRKNDPPPDAVVAADATRGAKLRVVRREYADVHPANPGVIPGFETWLILRRTET